MRIALRADSSDVIGTGHVMRQVAIAQHLLGLGVEVFLVGNTSEPKWLCDYVSGQSELVRVLVAEGDFAPELLQALRLDALLVDSYQITEGVLRSLESVASNVGVMLDGPGQKLAGSIAIAPTLDSSAEWLGVAEQKFTQFYWGPKFIPLREEVRGTRRRHQGRRPRAEIPQVVISTGGGASGLGPEILHFLLRRPKPVGFDVFFSLSEKLRGEVAKSPHTVKEHGRGTKFLEVISSADVVVGAAGTSAAELVFLGVPTIFVPIAANQAENAASIERLRLGAVVWPGSISFKKDLLAALDIKILMLGSSVNSSQIVDADGAMRIAAVMLPSMPERG
jgi:spore coat polysaccharide biosynthesis predicted glycosyltransferase SpsG